MGKNKLNDISLKAILVIIAVVIASNINAQSISASKIFKYLDNQKQTEISKELLSMGFVFRGKETHYNATWYSYHKTGSYGLEKFTVSYMDELFCIIYEPATNEVYSTFKEIMLTRDFGYSYSYKNTKYYENDRMRIGVNDTSKIISFFVKKE